MERTGAHGTFYTIRLGSANHELSFCVAHGQEPPSKIRLYHGSDAINVFSFDGNTNSYREMTKHELERFERGFKTGRCRHSEAVSRETGNERFDRTLTKLQKKLKDKKSNDDHCSYCEEYGGVINIEVQPADLTLEGDESQIKTDDLKLSEPEATALGPFSIKISWAESVANNEHLTGCNFELEMSKSKNSSFKNIYSGREQTFTKIDLLPGTKYYFRLRAVKNSIHGPFSAEVAALTDATAPATPDVPHIASKTRTSLLLKWTTKSDNGSPITSYVLQWDEGNANGPFRTIYEGSQKQYKFNHELAPMASCRFQVKALNKIGESDFSRELHYTASASVPSAPDAPSLVRSTANSLQLSWKEPNACGAAVTEYILQMDDVDKDYGFLPVYRGSDQMCTVDDNMKRSTTYKFRLSAINAQGESKWSDVISYSTTSQAPSRMFPPVLEGKAHTKSFAVSWAPSGDDGGSEILSYSLEIDDGKGGSFRRAYNGLDMTHKFQDLLPGHTYKVRVSCASSEFQSPWSDVNSIKTLPVISDPPSAPRSPKNCKPHPNTIEIVWDPPNYNGGASITSYNLQMAESESQEFKHVYLGPKNSCCASGLLPDKKYYFRVRAKNTAGDSKFSEVSSIYTGPGPPDPIQQLELVCRSSHAIKVSWKVPNHNGTPVTGYLLECARNFNGPFEKIYSGIDNDYGMKKSLLPSTVYYFRVQASSAVGNGSWSDIASCKTPAAPPAQVTDVKVVGQTSTSLTLQWHKSCDNGAAVTSYNIDVIGQEMLTYPLHDIETTDDTGEASRDTLEYTISDLKPRTQYRFRVQGVNKSGCGAFSSVISATTRSVPPEAPKLEMVNCSYQSIKLRWIPTRNEANELNYELQMRRSDTGSFETVFSGSTTSHKVGKLREQTTYCFRIRAANEAGRGPYSDVFMCETNIQPPSPVKGLGYSHLDRNKVTLSWKAVTPVQSNDRINYILQWQRKEVTELEQLYEGSQTIFTCDSLKSDRTYSFRVCAVRTLVDGRRIHSPFSSFITFTAPSEAKETVSDESSSPDKNEEDVQVRQFSEKELAMIFFIGFALVVLVMSFLIPFALG